MTTDQKVARRKRSLLELATELGNVSKACRVMGYSRQQFYEIRRNFQTYGAEGLLDRIAGARAPHPNRVSAAIEQAILDHALAHPCHGPVRVAHELLRGIQVSSGGVRGVWQRHGLLTKHERLLRLEQATAERTLKLTDEQVRLLERSARSSARATSRRRTAAPWSRLTPSSSACSKASARSTCRPRSTATAAMPGAGSTPTSCRSPRCSCSTPTLLPAFEAHGGRIDAILSDNGREFRGRPDRHPYELFLQLEGIAHRTTRVNRPQSNGIVERLHRTLLDEHFRIEGRRTWFETIEEMQAVLDPYLDGYNHRRPHQGRGMGGRTPAQAFADGLSHPSTEENRTKTPNPKKAA